MALASAFLVLGFLTVLYHYWDVLVDAAVLFIVSRGGTKPGRSAHGRARLLLYMVETTVLDNSSVREINMLLHDMMASSAVGLPELQDVLLSYKMVALWRDRFDGSLRGMYMIDEMVRKFRGRDIVQLRSGMFVVQKEYRGGVLPFVLYLARVLRQFVINPGKPVYLLSKLFSYKPYLVAMRNSDHAYPHYNNETPEFEKALMDDYGYSCETASRKYNPETGVLEATAVQLDARAAPITTEQLRDPDIAFFAKRNPQWSEGHCLIMCMKMTPHAFLRMFWRMVIKRGNGSTQAAGLRQPKRHVSRAASVSDYMNASGSSVAANPDYIIDSNGYLDEMF